MKTKLLLAAAVSALTLGAAGAQAAPVLAQNDIATQGTDSAIEQVHHRYYYGYYYNYYPYYYNYYRYCYWSYGYKYCY
jgi:hypothetical protein